MPQFVDIDGDDWFTKAFTIIGTSIGSQPTKLLQLLFKLLLPVE
jgi:hypothetical protein